MSTTFKNWQGQLMGTIHNSPGGIKTVVTKLSAPNPKTCTVYFHHPHFENLGTKAGRNARMMTVTAWAPDVYTWLCSYQHVSMSESLKHSTFVSGTTLADTVEVILLAEFNEKENIEVQIKVPGFRSRPQLRSSDMLKIHHIEPWYFVDASGHEILGTKVKKTVVAQETVDLMQKMGNPDQFQELDHDKLFDYLMKIKLDTLAFVWFLKPEYFQVLQVFAPDRWDQLYTRAKKGIIK